MSVIDNGMDDDMRERWRERFQGAAERRERWANDPHVIAFREEARRRREEMRRLREEARWTAE